MVKRNWIYSDSPLYFRKSENKTRSDTFDTFDVNGSIVEIYNPAHHRKAESGTAIFSGTAFVYAIETLPDSVQMFLTYSNTIIFHFTDNLVIFDLQDNMDMSIYFSVQADPGRRRGAAAHGSFCGRRSVESVVPGGFLRWPVFILRYGGHDL